MNTAQVPHSTAPSTVPSRTLQLDDLAEMTIEELTALYRGGTVPADISALDGDPTCRMVKFVGGMGRGRTGAGIASFASSSRFPWAGKSFTATAADRGHGINRVRLAGTRSWFPFDTMVQPSAIDGQPCIFLEYDKPENPWFIRKVHDELREVDPGLFLGPAMWKTSTEPSLILYFACDAG